MAVSILLVVIGILHFAHGLVEYVVYPTDKKAVTTNSQINSALVKICGPSRVQVYRSRMRGTTEFWVIRAIESTKQTVIQIPGVGICSQRLHDHNDNVLGGRRPRR